MRGKQRGKWSGTCTSVSVILLTLQSWVGEWAYSAFIFSLSTWLVHMATSPIVAVPSPVPVVWSPERQMDPDSKFGYDVQADEATHTGGCEKAYYLPNRGLWENWGQASWQVKMAWKSKERRLAPIVVGGCLGWGFLYTGRGWFGLALLPVPKEGAPGFFISLPRCGV